MIEIRCPWCGPRPQTEFGYGGDASRERPANPKSVPVEEWLDHVYVRDNPRGPHLEWWHHASGCRQWFRVRRDTLTHEVLGSFAPGEPAAEDGS